MFRRDMTKVNNTPFQAPPPLPNAGSTEIGSSSGGGTVKNKTPQFYLDVTQKWCQHLLQISSKISKQQSRQLFGFRRLFTGLNAELNRRL